MDIRKLQRAIVDGLEDVKAQQIAVFNTEHLSALFERVIIASGTSNRQTKSLAGSVRDAVKKAGYPVPRMEGEANGEWIIIDCGAAVVHVMQPIIREYYHLEEIWGDKPVRLKFGGAAPGLVKASERELPDDAPVRRAPAKKVRGVAADEPAPARKTARRRTSDAPGADAEAFAAKAPRRPTPVKKAAPATKKASVAPTPARKTARAPVDRTSAPTSRSRQPAAKVASKKASRSTPSPAGVTRVVGVKGGAAAKKTGASRAAAAKRPPARKRTGAE